MAAAYKLTERYGEYIAPYKCEECGNFHIGRPDKWRSAQSVK
jgi:predicted RNA-binding Zn-ribbon protein involved in translation (DUF1610 family)